MFEKLLFDLAAIATVCTLVFDLWRYFNDRE